MKDSVFQFMSRSENSCAYGAMNCTLCMNWPSVMIWHCVSWIAPLVHYGWDVSTRALRSRFNMTDDGVSPVILREAKRTRRISSKYYSILTIIFIRAILQIYLDRGAYFKSNTSKLFGLEEVQKGEYAEARIYSTERVFAGVWSNTSQTVTVTWGAID